MKLSQKILSSVLQLIIFTHSYNSVLSLSVSQRIEDNVKREGFHSGSSRQSRQILPTNPILLPNVGQYLALIQILVLKLVIWTQIMRLLGQDYVGKGIKSTVPLSEQQDLDEILDYDDLEAGIDLNQKKKRRRRRQTIHTTDTNTNIEEIKNSTNTRILDELRKFIKLKT